MSNTELVNLFKKSDETRLTYFLKQLQENGIIFGLSDEQGWAVLGDAEDESDPDILPLFPNAVTANFFKKGAGFEEMQAESIPMEELQDWLQEMQEENTLIAVFPNTRLECEVLEPEELMTLIEENT
jgi:hypothetical protein